MTTAADLISQIERVLAKFAGVKATWHSSTMVSGFRDTVAYYALKSECIALANHVYGAEHPQARQIIGAASGSTLHHLQATEGLLLGAIEALKHGLLSELRTQVLLDIKSDFLEAARAALDGGAKDVAAVLSCAVLEDSVKRLATKSGRDDLLDREYSVVVVELFKAEAITKATKGALLSHKDLRNSALHAQWHEVSTEAVQALMYLLPVFMQEHGV
jgi:hypothetical protein